MITKIFQAIAAPILAPIIKIIDDLVPDKDLANKLKNQIQNAMLNFDTKVIEGKVQIILAEARGGWLQRNWRPMLMVSVILIVVNNYIFFPYASMWSEKVKILELPNGLWALLNIGTGGYIVGRSAEKILKKD
jgi:hypothetical protein